MSSQLRVSPIYKSVSRQVTILGGEREPMLLLLIFSFAIVFTALTFQTTIVGGLIWIVGSFILRAMGKKDPKMFLIFLRHATRYPQRIYFASSRLFSLGYNGGKAQ